MFVFGEPLNEGGELPVAGRGQPEMGFDASLGKSNRYSRLTLPVLARSLGPRIW